ncbi:MAG TPA: glycoside hydrolase family 3 N-terminal domain-containing protein, partial [Spirillospora sp.]
MRHPHRRVSTRIGRTLVALATVTALPSVIAAPALAAPAAPPAVPANAPYLDARLPVAKRVDDLLSRMTLEEKVGQMAQAERGAIDEDRDQITELKLGSVLSGGGSVPADNTPEGWADMVDAYQEKALATRLKIPLLYGIDSVHGHGNLVGATVFPHNIGMGATRNPDLVRKMQEITAKETRATGPQWIFAPCVCVARDVR